MQWYHLVVQYRMTERCASIRNVNFPLAQPQKNQSRRSPDQGPPERDRACRAARSTWPSRRRWARVDPRQIERGHDGADRIFLGWLGRFWDGRQPLLQKVSSTHRAGRPSSFLGKAPAADHRVRQRKLWSILGVDGERGFAFSGRNRPDKKWRGGKKKKKKRRKSILA